jgi:hypothetical protein
MLIAKKLITLLLPLLLSTLSYSENMQAFGNYEVHYSVFNTSFLTPDIAEAYHITRSKSKALMNIAVLEKQADGSLKNVDASITGEQYDLIRHDPLSFQRVQEEHAIYYLSSFDIQNRTTIYFTVFIKPDTSTAPAYKLEFNKMLYRDE